MANTFFDSIKRTTNVKRTENGAVAHKSTLNAVYDLFAFGGAYRNRGEGDCRLLFKKAYEENPELALKCLFYLRDIIQGQGERRFFRECFKWLAITEPAAAKRNMDYVSDFGRWDDLIYATLGTPIEKDALTVIKNQLALDMDSRTPSLLAKWVPSENASNNETKRTANHIRKFLGLSHKEYRQMLSKLRAKINVLEVLMSANRWEEIEFDKIPSQAGLKYKNAFARRDIIAKKYEAFAKSKETTVNTKALYPYDIVRDIRRNYLERYEPTISNTERAVFDKYWENLPNYLEDNTDNFIAVVDTSGSMHSSTGNNVAPIDVAISLGLYCADKAHGPFHNHYITFSSDARLVECDGLDIIDRVQRIYRNNIVEDTNLESVFDLLLMTAKRPDVKAEDVPSKILVISDMEINRGVEDFPMPSTNHYYYWEMAGHEEEVAAGTKTLMEKIREKWIAATDKPFPNLVYWNVDARNNTILDLGPNVSYVSGCSPVILEQIMQGLTGEDLMLKKLNSDRYKNIK